MNQAMNVSVGQLKKELSSILNLVAYGRERVTVESRGRPKAVLISLEELESLERDSAGNRLEVQQRTERLLDRLAAFRERTRRPDVDADVAADVARVREERIRDLAGG